MKLRRKIAAGCPKSSVRDFLRARDTREEGRGREQVSDWRRAQSEILAKDSDGAHFSSPCTHICIGIYTYTCIHIYVRKYTYKYSYIHVYTYICIQIYLYVYVAVYFSSMSVYVYAYVL